MKGNTSKLGILVSLKLHQVWDKDKPLRLGNNFDMVIFFLYRGVQVLKINHKPLALALGKKELFFSAVCSLKLTKNL